MSWWTYIVATIDIDTWKERHDIKEYVEKLLKDAPPITGSERNADVFVNVRKGHNVSIAPDCPLCPFFGGYNAGGYEICRKPTVAKCIDPISEYQTRVVITVAGDLRDRHKPQTQAEWRAFKKYVESVIGVGKGSIMNCTCRIGD